MPRPQQCFVSYSHSDGALLQSVLPGLQGLAHLYGFKLWHDRRIDGGYAWDPAIKAAMDGSDLFFCLVTDRYFGSPYIFNEELPAARQAWEMRGALVIPAVFSGTLWQAYFGAHLQAIPSDTNGNLKAANNWRPKETGIDAVNTATRKAIESWFGIGPQKHFAAPAGAAPP